MPPTGRLIGTPAAISARIEPQVLAIEDEALLSVVSLTTRMVYGNTSSSGSTGTTAFSASTP